MEKRQFHLLIIVLLCLATNLKAQWEEPFSHYWEIKGYYNPSFAGKTDYINTAAAYNYKYSDSEYSPQRVVITADMPFQFLQLSHGTGIVAYSESIGKRRNTLLGIQYSFKQQLGKGYLNLGVQGGIYNLNYDTGRINLTHDSLLENTLQSNPMLKNKQVADLAAGISWTSNKFFAGLSILHLNQPLLYQLNSEIDTEKNSNPHLNNTLVSDSINSFISRTYNFIAGYNIGLFNSLEIEPIIWLLHDRVRTIAQATLRLEYDKRFTGGFSVFSESGYSIFAGAAIQGFRFGYAYSAYNMGIVSNKNYNHELFIRYNFPIYSLKPKLQPHKSIRFL